MSTKFPTTEAALARKAGKALLAETPAMPPAKLDVELLALEQIKPGKNPRKHFDQAALEELAASIKARGVLEPILVRSGPGFRGLKHPFELIAGERRLRAARLAGLDKIPARVLELDDKGAAEVRVIENEQREDLSPIEKAEGYQELLDKHGYKVEDLAAKIGKSAGTIYGLLKLLRLPAKARDAVVDGRLPAATATLIGRIPNDKLRSAAAAEILEGEGGGEPLSYRLAVDVIRRDYMRELKQAPFSTADTSLVASAGACTSCPKRTGNNRAEYPDGRDDTCTDPACFQAKVEAHNKRRLELLEAEGKHVRTGKEAAKIFPAGYLARAGDNGVGTRLPYNSSYIDLSDEPLCGGRKSYKALVGAELADEVLLVQDGAGQVRELVPKAKAEELARKKLKLPAERHGISDGWKRDRAKHRKAQDDKNTIARAMMGDIAQRATTIASGVAGLKPIEGLLRLLLHIFVDVAWDDIARHVVKRRGLPREGKGGGNNRGPVADLISKLDVYDLFGLFAELAAGQRLLGFDGEGKKELLDFFAIDAKRIERRVRSGKANPLTSPERGQREAAKRRRLHPEPAAAAG